MENVELPRFALKIALWKRQVLPKFSLVRSTRLWELRATKSLLKTEICWIINEWATHCLILLKFGRVVHFGLVLKLRTNTERAASGDIGALTATVSKLWLIIGQILVRDSGRPHFNALGGGDPLRISGRTLPHQRLEWLCYLTVKTAWSYLHLSRQNTGTWRKDRRTDRNAVGLAITARYALQAMRTRCKMQHQSKLWLFKEKPQLIVVPLNSGLTRQTVIGPSEAYWPSASSK